MVSKVFIIALIVIGAVMADEGDTCSQLSDCDCADVCHNGKCVKGCYIYDTFIAAGTQRTVHGRRCQCATDADIDEKGRPALCAEGQTFEGNPIMEMYTPNPKCSAAAPIA